MFEILRLLAQIMLITNFMLFLSKYGKGSKAYKLYSIYLGLIVLIEITIIVVVKMGYQNLIFSHLYFTGQFILLSLFYLELIKVRYQRNIIKLSLVVIPFILALNFYLNPEDIHKFSLIEILLTSMSLITFSVFHFYNMLSNKKEFYYINMGVLIYLFGSTVTFLPRNLHTVYGRNFSDVLHILNIVLYLFYLVLIYIEWYNIKIANKNEKN